jgi:hypothetical protein
MIRRLASGLAAAFGGAPTPAPGSPEEYDVRGFKVRVENTRPDIATRDVLERLDDALELIERHATARFRHLRRDLREIAVVRFPCRGAYFPDDRVVVAELTFLARRDITAAPVASSILHEGIHARIDCMGVQREGRDRAREERICRRAELTFGESLPHDLGAPVIERALASLQLADQDVAPAVDWGVALERQNRIDRQV